MPFNLPHWTNIKVEPAVRRGAARPVGTKRQQEDKHFINEQKCLLSAVQTNQTLRNLLCFLQPLRFMFEHQKDKKYKHLVAIQLVLQTTVCVVKTDEEFRCSHSLFTREATVL